MATSGTFSTRWESSTWAGRPKYYNWSGSWSKSGTTITLTNMQIYMGMVDPNAGGTGSGTDSITVSPGGSAQSVTFTWSGGNTSNTRSLNNVSFTVSGTATSQTIYCYIDGENTGSYTLSFDPAYVAPNTPTITATANSTGQVTVVYGTTSFGTPSTGTVTLYGGTTSSPTTSLDTYSSTGDKTFVHTGLAPGTTYYYRARANNGQLNSSYSAEVSATTSSVALYGSVNGQSKRVTKFYGSVNGQSKEITKLYGPAEAGAVAVNAWQGNLPTTFTGHLQFNVYVSSTTRTANSFRVVGKIGVTYPDKSSYQYAYSPQDLEAEVGGQTVQIYQANERVYGDGGDGTSSAITTDFDVTVPLSSDVSTYAFPVVIKQSSPAEQASLSWALNSSLQYVAKRIY